MLTIRTLRLVRPRQSFICTANRTLKTTSSQSTPWFIDLEEPSSSPRRAVPPHLPEPLYELPAGIPDSIRILYDKLSKSPFLEPSTLVAREPPKIPPGPLIPERRPKGRRRIRGKTYAGQSLLDSPNGIWNWVVMAQVCCTQSPLANLCMNSLQVKEGTENRGSIESVVRIVRKTVNYFVLLPPPCQCNLCCPSS